MKLSLSYFVLFTIANCATVPSSPWTALTPTATLGSDSGATDSLSASYALSVKTILTASELTASASAAKREDADEVVNQISDGQIQQQTDSPEVVNQISDGQVQQQTAAPDVVNQISDGQVQQQTAADVVNQISDGQVQQQTAADVVNQISDGQVQQQTAAPDVVNQISDGQVQQQTAAPDVANQISDGQVQQQTDAPTPTVDAVSQISDGQIQQATETVAGQIEDGQVQSGGETVGVCVKQDSLLLTLKDGILSDTNGRIGSIVANRQFQFDGPPPQAGAIYANGWCAVPSDYKEDSDTKEKADNQDKEKRESDQLKLALGKQTTFYKCLSGSFYNLYDESIGGQCSEVELVLLEAVKC